MDISPLIYIEINMEFSIIRNVVIRLLGPVTEILCEYKLLEATGAIYTNYHKPDTSFNY